MNPQGIVLVQIGSDIYTQQKEHTPIHDVPSVMQLQQSRLDLMLPVQPYFMNIYQPSYRDMRGVLMRDLLRSAHALHIDVCITLSHPRDFPKRLLHRVDEVHICKHVPTSHLVAAYTRFNLGSTTGAIWEDVRDGKETVFDLRRGIQRGIAVTRPSSPCTPSSTRETPTAEVEELCTLDAVRDHDTVYNMDEQTPEVEGLCTPDIPDKREFVNNTEDHSTTCSQPTPNVVVHMNLLKNLSCLPMQITVSGGAGSGKTSLVLKILQCLSTGQGIVVLLGGKMSEYEHIQGIRSEMMPYTPFEENDILVVEDTLKDTVYFDGIMRIMIRVVRTSLGDPCTVECQNKIQAGLIGHEQACLLAVKRLHDARVSFLNDWHLPLRPDVSFKHDELIIMVVGGRSRGKTTLVRQILKQRPAKVKRVFIFGDMKEYEDIEGVQSPYNYEGCFADDDCIVFEERPAIPTTTTLMTISMRHNAQFRGAVISVKSSNDPYFNFNTSVVYNMDNERLQ